MENTKMIKIQRSQITECQEYTQLLIKYEKHWNTQNSQENNNIIT